MAALRFLARSKLSTFLRVQSRVEHLKCASPTIHEVQKREMRYGTSPTYDENMKYTDYEISKDPNEWKFVERLLPYKVIPPPKNELNLPSNWKPATAKPTDYPYFVQRTRNYMMPVYLEIRYRGMQRITVISKINGDIWALEGELRKYIIENINKPIGAKVNEFAGVIKFKGDYVSLVKKWLEEKGF